MATVIAGAVVVGTDAVETVEGAAVHPEAEEKLEAAAPWWRECCTAHRARVPSNCGGLVQNGLVRCGLV